MEYHSFRHLWELSTAFVLMQVSTGFDAPYLAILCPIYTKVEWTLNSLNIYPKYGKLFIETMTLPASYVMTRLWNDYLI